MQIFIIQTFYSHRLNLLKFNIYKNSHSSLTRVIALIFQFHLNKKVKNCPLVLHPVGSQQSAALLTKPTAGYPVEQCTEFLLLHFLRSKIPKQWRVDDHFKIYHMIVLTSAPYSSEIILRAISSYMLLDNWSFAILMIMLSLWINAALLIRIGIAGNRCYVDVVSILLLCILLLWAHHFLASNNHVRIVSDNLKTPYSADYSQTLIIKVKLCNDIRKILIQNDDVTYDELVCIMQRVFKDKLSATDDHDEDGDLSHVADSVIDALEKIERCSLLTRSGRDVFSQSDSQRNVGEDSSSADLTKQDTEFGSIHHGCWKLEDISEQEDFTTSDATHLNTGRRQLDAFTFQRAETLHFSAEVMRAAELHPFPSATHLTDHMSFQPNSRRDMFQIHINTTGYISSQLPSTITGSACLLNSQTLQSHLHSMKLALRQSMCSKTAVLKVWVSSSFWVGCWQY
ncbi:Protein TFG [Trichinella pseudospiralis]|uniref:Protein TFG n=1 Tax=Trichinella pseudospiralis TaxID=6337 RepID=A0A0V1FPM4_TRIPS|nr:Protein TFG [Trichinella pseudospiralis]